MEDVEKVYFGESVLALKTDNSLWGWGNNKRGQLGLGTDVKSSAIPVKIMDDVSDVLVYFDEFEEEIWDYEEKEENSIHDELKEKIALLFKAEDEWGEYYGGWGSTDDDYEEEEEIVDRKIYSAYALKTDGSLYTWGSTYFKELDSDGNHRISTPQHILDNVNSIKDEYSYDGEYSYGNIYAISDKKLIRWENTGDFFDAKGELFYTEVEQLLDDVVYYEKGYAIKSDDSLWGIDEREIYKLLNGVEKVILGEETYYSYNDDEYEGSAITKNGELWQWEMDDNLKIKVAKKKIG